MEGNHRLRLSMTRHAGSLTAVLSWCCRLMALRAIRLVVGGVPLNRALTWSYPHGDGQIYVIPTYRMIMIGTDVDKKPMSQTFEVLRFGVHRTTKNLQPRIVGIARAEGHTIKRWIPNYKVHSADSREDGAWQVHGNFLIHDGPDYPMRQLYATAGCIEVCGGPGGFVAFNRLVAQWSGSSRTSLSEMLAEVGSSGCLHIAYEQAARPELEVWDPKK